MLSFVAELLSPRTRWMFAFVRVVKAHVQARRRSARVASWLRGRGRQGGDGGERRLRARLGQRCYARFGSSIRREFAKLRQRRPARQECTIDDEMIAGSPRPSDEARGPSHDETRAPLHQMVKCESGIERVCRQAGKPGRAWAAAACKRMHGGRI